MKSPLEQTETIRNLLAVFLVSAFVAAMAGLMFKGIPASNEQIITYMVGQLSGMATMALGFYFVNKVGQDALDAAKTENSKAAFRAIEATAKATGGEAAANAAEETAEAAKEKAAEFSDATLTRNGWLPPQPSMPPPPPLKD